jgi:hypothetical protein
MSADEFSRRRLGDVHFQCVNNDNILHGSRTKSNGNIDTLEKRDDFMFTVPDNMFSSLGAIGLSDGDTWMTCTFMFENIDNMIDEWKDAHLIHKRLTCTFMCDSI